jgi:hypothetical protein
MAFKPYDERDTEVTEEDRDTTTVVGATQELVEAVERLVQQIENMHGSLINGPVPTQGKALEKVPVSGQLQRLISSANNATKSIVDTYPLLAAITNKLGA